MTENPYESPRATSSTPKTRATRWLVWSGIGSLGLALACVIATVVVLILAFESLATSTQPIASDSAQAISLASLPAMAVVPLGVLGIVLLIAGFLVRQRRDRP